jgi:hypothetical protein
MCGIRCLGTDGHATIDKSAADVVTRRRMVVGDEDA